jgi:Tol biopolymer transport system component
MQLTDTADPRSSDNPTWSPDSSRILYDSNTDGAVKIWVMDADGSNQEPLIPNAFGRSSWPPVLKTTPETSASSW